MKQSILATEIIHISPTVVKPIIEIINQEIERHDIQHSFVHLQEPVEPLTSISVDEKSPIPIEEKPVTNPSNPTDNFTVEQQIDLNKNAVIITEDGSVQGSVNEQNLPGTSTEGEGMKSPQNLSELVEDTQRLIKQMKDEINAIYVSDDDSPNSEDYSEDWADGDYLDDEYIEEESEFEDWSGSGEYIESDGSVLDQNETVMDDESHEINLQNNSLVSDMPNDTESINSITSTLANGSEESSDNSNVIHGKLELTPMATVTEQERTQVFIVESSPFIEKENNGVMDQAGISHAKATDTIPPAQHHIPNSNNAISIVITDLTDGIEIPEIIFDNEVIKSPDIQITEIQSAPVGYREVFESVTEVQVEIYDDTIKRKPSFVIITEIVDDESTFKSDASSPSDFQSANLTTIAENTINDVVNIENSSGTIQPIEEILQVVDNLVISESVIARQVIEVDDTENATLFAASEEISSTLPIQSELEVPNYASTSSVIESESIAEVISASIEIVPPRAIKKTGTIKRKKSIITPTDVQKAKDTLDNVLQAQMAKAIETESPRKNSLGNSNSLGAKKKTVDNSTISGRKASIDKPRKNSFVGPFGFLSSSNVKNMQKEFLNKTSSTETAGSSKSQPTKLKPSKLTQPKSFANKLTKLITPTVSNVKSKDVGLLVDHSKSKIPKKKYIETCFSDDYQSSDDDKEQKNYPDMQKPMRIVNKFAQQSDEDEEKTREVWFFKLLCLL